MQKAAEEAAAAKAAAAAQAAMKSVDEPQRTSDIEKMLDEEAKILDGAKSGADLRRLQLQARQEEKDRRLEKRSAGKVPKEIEEDAAEPKKKAKKAQKGQDEKEKRPRGRPRKADPEDAPVPANEETVEPPKKLRRMSKQLAAEEVEDRKTKDKMHCKPNPKKKQHSFRYPDSDVEPDAKVVVKLIEVIEEWKDVEVDREELRTAFPCKQCADMSCSHYWDRPAMGILVRGPEGDMQQRFYFGASCKVMAANLLVAQKMAKKLFVKGKEWHCSEEAQIFAAVLRRSLKEAIKAVKP